MFSSTMFSSMFSRRLLSKVSASFNCGQVRPSAYSSASYGLSLCMSFWLYWIPILLAPAELAELTELSEELAEPVKRSLASNLEMSCAEEDTR